MQESCYAIVADFEKFSLALGVSANIFGFTLEFYSGAFTMRFGPLFLMAEW